MLKALGNMLRQATSPESRPVLRDSPAITRTLSLDLDASNSADLETFVGALGRYRALRVKDGDQISLGIAAVDGESLLYLHAGLRPEMEPRDARVAVSARPASPGAEAISTVEAHFSDARREVKLLFELPGWSGAYEFFIEVRGVPEALIVDAAVASEDHLPGTLAMSGYRWRLGNEVAHFSGAAYTHAMYGASGGAPGNVGGHVIAAAGGSIVRNERAFVEQQRTSASERLASMQPIEGETAYNFGMRCLGALLPMQPPDFFRRMASISSQRPVRLLSLCAGAARIEEMLLEHCANPAELYLLDASEDLIGRAARRIATGKHRVHCVLGDVNVGLPVSGPFDVIMCVSALHHVANLELVFSQINQQLAPGGEFWSIGEQVGRNGNRLWPDTRRFADAVFARLPEKYRRNAHTAKVDPLLPDRDFSVGCFEGIRSEEIEVQLERHFVPLHVYKRNCFLWRMIDATYTDNYDLRNADDVEVLRGLIADEFVHWTDGGRSTELHGAYRRKELALG
jgi:SAM-dependent methyltransferase